MLDEKYIANRIKELCDKKQMTMYALSKKTDISQSSLSNLMKRGSTPTFYTLNRICDGLGITLAQFFSDGVGKLELSSEQRKVLEMWETLTDKEKEAVEIYVRGMKLK
ncbi:helix-turn-helix domain-containing protein [Extibacter sp. GGCC_0201]|uniref:helix-turn-helix domain-containing protein n=1 Tax=Extibacter sp. GGCC_0201 TaxID=2731209 RepID=UPI001AA12BCD|nr:helix-turn-helix transcriptional regulator [Extibacter sp. GGCC_0201]MBO1720093.1 helix-turn-helix transcriptional regulator [Extibacter sp. GGCC_0201]